MIWEKQRKICGRKRAQKLAEIFREAVLAAHGKRVDVERAVGVKVGAERVKKLPAGGKLPVAVGATKSVSKIQPTSSYLSRKW